MNKLKITPKPILVLAFLFFLIDSYSQQKLIGLNNRGSLDGNGNAFSINTNGTGYTKNVEFPNAPGIGIDMVDGNDGYFYGSAFGNGYGDAGTIFKVKYNGTDYTILRKFIRASDGGSIHWHPVVAADGFLYGVCENGGNNNNGTIWKLSKDGNIFAVLRHLNTSTEAVSGTNGSLVMGLDGRLYGNLGGANGFIIRVNTNGNDFTKLVAFTNVNGAYPGSTPGCPMLLGSDGIFYGVCAGGGTNSKGVAYKYNPFTATYSVLKVFSDNDGAYPINTPIEGADGYIIGGCPNYGTLNSGTIWKVKKDASAFTVLQQLDMSVTGIRPSGKMYIHTDGLIYGVTSAYGPSNNGSFFKMAQDGTGLTVLRSDFDGLQASSLMYRETGNKFFIAFGYGGAGSGGFLESVNPDGTGLTRVYQFGYYTEGSGPVNAPCVITNPASAQYAKAFATTISGGVNGNGNLFSYYPALANQRDSIVHNFKNEDGYSPAGRASAILGSDDWLYGVLGYGGPITGNTGTIYRVNPNDTSTFAVIKSFGNFGTSPTNCIVPEIIMEAADGYLYGNTSQGGANNRGTIFKMKKDGTDYSNLYQFGGSNTLFGGGGFIQDAATQKLIGLGSLSNSDAVIFTMNTDGSGITILKTFASANATTEGRNPAYPLLLLNDTLYGNCAVTANGYGGIFKMHKNGTGYTVLKSFLSSEGGSPYSNLQIGEDGYLYGTCGGTLSGSNGANIYKIRKDGTGYTVLKSFGTDMNDLQGNAPGQVILMPCSAPQNASAITFSNVTTSSITVSGFTPPVTGGVTGYVVKMNKVNSFTAPANGTVPTASTTYAGSGEQVIYTGTTVMPITVTGLVPNTQYWFKVFTYGCNGGLYNSANTTNNPNMQRTVPTGVVRPANLMARFDGIDDYANAGDVNALEGNTAISFGGWIKPKAFPVTNFKLKSFVGKGDATTASNTAFQAGVYRNDGSTVMVSAQISIGGVLAKVELPIDSSMFRINQWSHFFVTWNNGDKIKLYINGRMVIQSLVTYTGTINNIAAPLKLGSSNNTANEENFYGDMEEMQFYNLALSQCEIRQRKHITLTGTEPGLVAYYQFNEPDATATFNDYINGNNSSKQNGILALTSDLSAGGGSSDCISIQSTDNIYRFDASDRSNRLEMRFPALSPNGLLNGSYIEAAPVGGNPNPGTNMLPGYWIIDNYGANQSNLNATLAFRFADGILTDATASNYRLYKRPSNGSGTWELFPVTAVSLATGNNVITVAGIPSFSQLVITSAVSALPLQLLSFEGSLVNADAALQWGTVNEVNVLHFELERKLPTESSFTGIATINAKNNSNNNYSFTDPKIPTGTTWYRLKITDKDGKVTYSNIITVSNKTKAVTIFPNPAKDKINIIYPVAAANAKASILGVDGRVVLSNINITSNINTVNIEQLVPGIYILKIESASGTEMQRFIKQ